MKMLTHDIWLKCITHFKNKLLRSMSPYRKYNIINRLFILFQSEINVTAVFQKLWPIIKFRRQLFHITWSNKNRWKLFLNWRKETISMIDTLSLMFPMQMNIRFKSDKKIVKNSWIWKHSTIEESLLRLTKI